MKTDIPKKIKIELWRLMRDNPTYDAFGLELGEHYDQIFARFIKAAGRRDFAKYKSMKRDTYRALKHEIQEMPVADVVTLPHDLQGWVIQLRPDMAWQLEEYLDELTPEERLALGYTPTLVFDPVKKSEATAEVVKGSKRSASAKSSTGLVNFRTAMESVLGKAEGQKKDTVAPTKQTRRQKRK